MSAPNPASYQLESVRAVAKRLKLTCLEDAWLGWQVRHRFRCEQGHVFERLPNAVIRSKCQVVCPTCLGQVYLERLQAVARGAQVECLDDQWRGADALYNFRCPLGHTWQRRSTRANANASCPVCNRQHVNKRKQLSDGLARLQQAAQSKGGECLSDHYGGTAQRYRFRCSEGHEWLAAGCDILSKGHWCRLCADQHKRESYRLANGLERLRALAEKRGGLCLSDVYVGGGGNVPLPLRGWPRVGGGR